MGYVNTKLARRYAPVLVSIAAYLVLLAFMLERPPVVAARNGPRELIQPIVGLVVLTGVVWILMFVYRNVAVVRRTASLRYYRSYTSDTPPEWVERPARTFMNLLEVPVLFYVLCVLMLQTGRWDSIQLSLAWLFVASRYLHAGIYIALNDVPLRFSAYAMGCITLSVMWWRFAATSI
jgi:hypothetical protein